LLCSDTIEEKAEAMKEDKRDRSHALLADIDPFQQLGEAAIRALLDLPEVNCLPAKPHR
jgi:hypothetical protein